MFSSLARELAELEKQRKCTNFPDDQEQKLDDNNWSKFWSKQHKLSKVLERFKSTRQINGFDAAAWLEAFPELDRIKDKLNNPKLHVQEILTCDDKKLIFEGIYRDLGKYLELSPDADRSDAIEVVAMLHAMYSQVKKSYSEANLLYINFDALDGILTHLLTIIKTHPNPLSLLKANKMLYTDNFIEHGHGELIDTSLQDAAELCFPKKHDELRSLPWVNMHHYSEPHIIIEAIRASEDKMSTARELMQCDNLIDAAKNLLAVKYSSTICRP